MDLFVRALEERAKELNCLYKIEEILSIHDQDLEYVFHEIIKALPQGCKYPYYCDARIILNNKEFQQPEFKESPWTLKAPIYIQDEIAGTIELYYVVELPEADEGPFIKEEKKLLITVADRLSHYILHQRLKVVFEEMKANKKVLVKPKPEWMVVLEMLKKTDQGLFSIVSKKMINHLYFKGIEKSQELFKKLGTLDEREASSSEINMPSKKQVLENSFNLGQKIFKIAESNLQDEEIMILIQKWMNEEKTTFLVRALANISTPHNEIADALRKFINTIPERERQSASTQGINVALARRFLSDQLEFIDIAKHFGNVDDYNKLLQNMIYPADSHGKIGGKGAGLIVAKRILENDDEFQDLLSEVKTPKTWYVTSDAFMYFLYYNNFEDIIEQKYKDSDAIRHEYPHIIQAFKNSQFPSVMINGLSRALDDFGDRPIIVRSSSLLEDRMGTAFAGKYKSLFLSNQGTKIERLDALMDAIAEVYASLFGPDPIGYRNERGLIDFNEEMGVMIQEVVGQKHGKYFFPAFAGVGFSNNEFRWSPRIKRTDGLLRIVPGLGTRAVDRLPDDHPILIAPGQPNLRLYISFEDVVKYSPKYMDVINLETKVFDTIEIDKLVKEVGNTFPLLNQVFSILEQKHVKTPVGLGIDTDKDDLVATFENMITNTKFIKQLQTIIKLLQEKMQTPVDIEFACNGENLYLLQSRPQSSHTESNSAAIPTDIPPERQIFSANKYVSNGQVPDIAYIVYVDPANYSKMTTFDQLKDVGRAVGKLNKLLPQKSFILMGPGRWGSRDDIRLGVSVTYSDINNTAALIEIARKKGNYVPDLSFGTHFFQDLVEASIRYLPLYPDEGDVIFNDDFLLNSTNTLTRFLPEFEHLENTLRVINIRENTDGMILRMFLNADKDQALAAIMDSHLPTGMEEAVVPSNKPVAIDKLKEPMQWRIRMIENLASNIDQIRFGVSSVFLFGTVFNETAGPNSDIDILIHFTGTYKQKNDLENWLDGWNQCLSLINYNKTGYKIDRILDYYIMNDDELVKQKYYADLMDLSSNHSRELSIMKTNK